MCPYLQHHSSQQLFRKWNFHYTNKQRTPHNLPLFPSMGDAAEGAIHMQIIIDFHSTRQSGKPKYGSQNLSPHHLYPSNSVNMRLDRITTGERHHCHLFCIYIVLILSIYLLLFCGFQISPSWSGSTRSCWSRVTQQRPPSYWRRSNKMQTSQP